MFAVIFLNKPVSNLALTQLLYLYSYRLENQPFVFSHEVFISLSNPRKQLLTSFKNYLLVTY